MRRPPRLRSSAVLVAAVASLTGACGDRSGKTLDDPIFPPPATTTTVPTTAAPQTAPPAPLTLVAPWVDGAAIPDRHTCAGEGFSPPLSWSDVPLGTVELALSVVDLDAGQYVHWLVYGVGPGSSGTAEEVAPDGALEWTNSTGTPAWAPPCPPSGETHRYVFTLYALNQQLEVADDAGTNEVLSALDATSIAQSSISGLATGVG